MYATRVSLNPREDSRQTRQNNIKHTVTRTKFHYQKKTVKSDRQEVPRKSTINPLSATCAYMRLENPIVVNYEQE